MRFGVKLHGAFEALPGRNCGDQHAKMGERLRVLQILGLLAGY